MLLYQGEVQQLTKAKVNRSICLRYCSLPWDRGAFLQILQKLPIYFSELRASGTKAFAHKKERILQGPKSVLTQFWPYGQILQFTLVGQYWYKGHYWSQ